MRNVLEVDFLKGRFPNKMHSLKKFQIQKRCAGFFGKIANLILSLDIYTSQHSFIGAPVLKEGLESENFFHENKLDYVSARQLAHAQEDRIELLFDDYALYLKQKQEEEVKNTLTNAHLAAAELNYRRIFTGDSPRILLMEALKKQAGMKKKDAPKQNQIECKSVIRISCQSVIIQQNITEQFSQCDLESERKNLLSIMRRQKIRM